MTKNMTIKDKWNNLNSHRSSLLQRARECAALTLPYILPPDTSETSETMLSTPYQSVGARGVNTIAAKLTLALLPPNASFFNLEIGDKNVSDKEKNDAEVQGILQDISNNAGIKYVDKLLLRPALHSAMQHAAITGNALLYISPNGAKVFPFNQWVVQRNGEGKLIELILKESFKFNALPKEWQKRLISEGKASKDNNNNIYEKYDVYTYNHWDENKNKWEVIQEVNGIRDTPKYFTKETFPFFVIRWHSIAGDAYGRGIIEQYLGDLKTLEELNKSLISGAIQASRTVWLVSPESVLTPTDIQDAFDGDVKIGYSQDVSAIQLNKAADFSWILNQINGIEQNLSKDFLMLNGVIRDAERVTATEIRAITQEIETTLGGVFSALASELLLPLANFLLYKFITDEKPDLKDVIKQFNVITITGLNAVGRGEDFNRLATFTSMLQEIPNAYQYINFNELLLKLALSIGVDKNIVKTSEEIQQEQQQAMLMQLAQQQVPQQGMPVTSEQPQEGGLSNG